MITASNLRQSGMFLTVELPDETEVDIRRALDAGWETLIQHILDKGELWSLTEDILYALEDSGTVSHATAELILEQITVARYRKGMGEQSA